MHKIEFQPIPVKKGFYSSKLNMTLTQSEKFLALSDQEQDKLYNAFIRGILCQCTSTNKVFKIEPFKKLIQETMSLTVPTGTLIPILNRVNNTLMDVYGYAIAPINYAGKATILDNPSSIKELVLINITNDTQVNEANHSTASSADQGKLFWIICYLFLSNGSEVDKLKDHFRMITGDSSPVINSFLDMWERQRYINSVKIKTNDGEMLRYEVGLRAFHEIGYENLTKFVAVMEGIEYSDEIVDKWLKDTLGQQEQVNAEKKEKTITKEAPATKRRGRKKKEEEEPEFEDFSE